MAGDAWRVVEHQYTVSTRKLVDTKDEQSILEDILEASKPPYPKATEKLHYLLKTPFRYGS
ncbi:MAG: RES domain-containing protein, partial [Thiotrichales bacterium]|nr:RES domain-containing protein [Thiotrichales bacterium]